jgi:hypothetical protein
MVIKAITYGLSTLPFLKQISTLANRVQTVVNKNKDAEEEALVTDMLVTAGACFGFGGASIVRACNHNFSVKSSLFWSVIGGLVGMAVSTPLLYPFISKFKERESQI